MIRSSGAIIYVNKKYFLQLREKKKNIYFPGFWGVFGGLLEKREGFKKGLEREVKEETNLSVLVHKMILSNNFIFLNHERRERKYFECKILGKKKIILKEGEAYKLFSFEQIKKLKVVPLDFAAINYHYLSTVKKRKYLP